MKIVVTQEDIDGGCHLSMRNCPVARALARYGFENIGPAVQNFYDLSMYNHLNAICPTPKEVHDFIKCYDIFKGGIPFMFECPPELMPYRTGKIHVVDEMDTIETEKVLIG